MTPRRELRRLARLRAKHRPTDEDAYDARIATPDGVELVNLTASVTLAVAFVPYGIHLMRTERAAE